MHPKYEVNGKNVRINTLIPREESDMEGLMTAMHQFKTDDWLLRRWVVLCLSVHEG